MGFFRAAPEGKRTCELVVREWETEGGVAPRLNTEMEPSNELAISVSFSLCANINLIIEKLTLKRQKRSLCGFYSSCFIKVISLRSRRGV